MLTHAGSMSIGVAVFLASHGNPCVAQSPPSFILPFYGQTTGEEREEARAWSVAFWERVESGNPQTFVPQQAAWQSPLFNPLRSTRATLERLRVIDPADCDWEIISATEGSPLWEKRQALKESMISGKFETDPVINTEGFQNHLDAVFNAPAGTNVEAAMENGALVSTNLPLSATSPQFSISIPADARAYQGMTQQQIDQASAALFDLVNTMPALAQACSAVPESQGLITGLPTRADQVESLVRQRLMMHGFDPLTTRYDLAFGVYGSLPVIQAQLGGAVAFVDGWSGFVYGPFPEGVELVLGRMLNPYMIEYDLSSESYRAFSNAEGCLVKFARTWIPWNPTTATPPVTLTPMPALPGGTPGRPDVSCIHDSATGVCTCTAYRKITVTPCPVGAPTQPGPGGTCYILEKTVCTWNVNSGGCTASDPNWTTSPPAIGSWPTPVATCTTSFGGWQ